MNITTSELQKFFELIEKRNFSVTQIIALIQSKTEEVATEFNLCIDYSRNLQEMINTGNYHWKNDDIAEKNFSVPIEFLEKKIIASTKLFHLNRSISSEDAISEMNKAGYRPANLAELLALGEAHPELQKEFPIVALGSVWRGEDGFRYVPVLYFDGYERLLYLHWFDFDWHDSYRFFGVRK